MYKTRCDTKIIEDKRREYIYGEFELAAGEIDIKAIETGNKANLYRYINVSSSLAILIFSSISIGLELAGDCINIPVIVFASLICLTEGSHKLLNWGPQGIIYKQNTIRLKRIRREIKNVMLQFHTFSLEWLLAIIGQLWTEYDDIDYGLYKSTTAGPVTFNSGLDIEQGGGNRDTPVLNRPSLHPTPVVSPPRDRSSPHFHIHLDKTPDNNNSNIASTPVRKEYSTKLFTEKVLPKIILDEDIVSPVNLNTDITRKNIQKYMDDVEKHER